MRGKTAEEVRAELVKAGLKGSDLEDLIPHKVWKAATASDSINEYIMPTADIGCIGLMSHCVGFRGKPPHKQHSFWQTHPHRSWRPHCPLRAQGSVQSLFLINHNYLYNKWFFCRYVSAYNSDLYPRCGVEHQQLRPMGSGTRQAARQGHSPWAWWPGWSHRSRCLNQRSY